MRYSKQQSSWTRAVAAGEEASDMPWTKDDYPDSLKNFMAPIRYKAIEIANALLEDGYEEGRAIAIATAQAKEWGENRDKQIRKKSV
jgi:uncharacterized protein YdaT